MNVRKTLEEPLPNSQQPITAFSAYISAGGQSLRFEGDKSMFPINGKPLISHVNDILAQIFGRVIILANDPGKYDFMGREVMPDSIPGLGPIGGLLTALEHCATDRIFFCACDMPNLNPGLIRYMTQPCHGADVVIPCKGQYIEPLHAVYGRSCAPHLRNAINAGIKRIPLALGSCVFHRIPEDEVRRFGDPEVIFYNINYRHDVAQPGNAQ